MAMIIRAVFFGVLITFVYASSQLVASEQNFSSTESVSAVKTVEIQENQLSLMPKIILLFAKDEGGDAKHNKTAFLDFKADLGIYTLVVFFLLFFILSKNWKKIIALLDEREENIKKGYQDSESLREEAKKLLEEAKQTRQRTTDEVRTMLETARKDAIEIKERIKHEGNKELQSERDRLLREIESARDQALQNIWSQAVDLATMLSTKAVKREISTEDHQRLVNEAMQEIQQSLKV